MGNCMNKKEKIPDSPVSKEFAVELKENIGKKIHLVDDENIISTFEFLNATNDIVLKLKKNTKSKSLHGIVAGINKDKTKKIKRTGSHPGEVNME